MARLARKKQNQPKINVLVTKKQGLMPQVVQARDDLTTIENQIRGLEGQIDRNNPNSTNNQKLRSVISQLDKRRGAKESEVKSLSDKIDKIDERISNIRTGAPTTP